jgi:hypothetical protein
MSIPDTEFFLDIPFIELIDLKGRLEWILSEIGLLQQSRLKRREIAAPTNAYRPAFSKATENQMK